MSTPRLRLGQLLVDAKLVSEQALNEVLELQRTDGRRLGSLLVERGLINETQLTQILSHQLSVPWVSLLHIEFSRQLLSLVPYSLAEQYCLVPIYVRHVRHQGETLYVAMDDPTNEEGLRACRECANLPVRAMIAPPQDIRNAIRVYYGITNPDRGASPDLIETDAPPAPMSASAVVPSPPSPVPTQVKEPIVTELEPTPLPDEDVVEDDAPLIEAFEVPVRRSITERSPADKLRAILIPDSAPPSSEREDDAPEEQVTKARGRSSRVMSLTLLDGTTITLPAKRPKGGGESEEANTSESPRSERRLRLEGSGADETNAISGRELMRALKAMVQEIQGDAAGALGENELWEPLFAAMLSVLLKKRLITEAEIIEELKKG